MTSSLRWTPFDAGGLRWQVVPFGRMATGGTPTLLPGTSVVVAIGAFDGLHAGHRALLSAAADDASRRGVPCVAVTFDPDPAALLAGSDGCAGMRLLRCDDRAAALLDAGADVVLSLRFDEGLALRTPVDFVGEVLCSSLAPVAVHVGENFRFGRNGAGDAEVLADLGRTMGFSVVPHALVRKSGLPVSSTRIRTLLAAGHLDEATLLLGRYHYVRGMVEHGRGEATAFGFPTANIRCDAQDCMVKEGVYGCYITCGDRAWPAAANVGAPPTFGGDGRAFLEANLLGFSGDLYGQEVSVSFVRWLRASRKFDSLEELERVVLGNIAWVSGHLGSSEIPISSYNCGWAGAQR